MKRYTAYFDKEDGEYRLKENATLIGIILKIAPTPELLAAWCSLRGIRSNQIQNDIPGAAGSRFVMAMRGRKR